MRWGVADMVWRQRHKKTGAKEPLLRCGTPDQILTGGLPLRSTAFQFCVLFYFLYSFFSFHIMLYGGYT